MGPVIHKDVHMHDQNFNPASKLTPKQVFSMLSVQILALNKRKRNRKTRITFLWKWGTKQEVTLNTSDKYFKPPFFLKISVFDALNVPCVLHLKY